MKKLFLIAAALAVFSQASTGFCEGLIVKGIQLRGLAGVEENKVMDLIPFKKGDQFKMENLDLAIGYLRQWGVFDTIEAKTKVDDHEVIVDINFKMAKVVTQIDVQGNYPYLENKILKHLTLHAGDIHTYKRVEDQKDLIKGFYEKEGYIGTEVFVKEKDQPIKNGVALTFKIKRGDLLRYRKIEIIGNKAYPSSRFTSQVNTWRPYSERRLRNSIRELKDLYRLNGYPKAKVWVASKKVDVDSRHVDLVIEVREGPFVRVKFDGNKATSDRVLRDKITVFKEGSFDIYEMEASEEVIKNLYMDSGYPEISVESSKIVKDESNIVITFKIKEGVSKIVRRIKFKGNDHISSRRLRGVISTKQRAIGYKRAFNPSIIAEDSDAIRKEYGTEGYLDSEVGEWVVGATKQGFDIDIAIPVNEGEETVVSEVFFEGNNSFSDSKLRDALKVRSRKTLDMSELTEDKARLVAYYANHGFPHAEIIQEVQRESGAKLARIVYKIKEGLKVKIGRILIVGDVLTSQKAIKGAMSIKEGEDYSYKEIVESRLALRRLGAFSSVKIDTIGLSEREPVVHLLVDVNEGKPFLLDLGLSYSTDQNFTGFLAFRNLNSFGWGKHTKFKVAAGRDLARGEIGWFDPRFLGSSFEMSADTWLQHVREPAFNYIQTAGSLGFFRRYKSFGFLFKYELDRNYLVEGSSTTADAESLRDNTISKVTLSTSYDTRDSFSNPTKGWFALGGVDFFNEIGGNQANFIKFNWQGENDLTFFKRITLSTALRFNRIQTVGSNISVPTNELLFLGGDDTVRGFGEDDLGPVDASGDATGGRTRWIVNEELRLHLGGRLNFAIFYDMGSLTYDFTDIDLYNIRNSIGFGLRYITPVGPIRADYGIKLDKRSGENLGRFHLTFGYVF